MVLSLLRRWAIVGLAAMAAGLLSAKAPADDWPHFLGPDFTNMSKETGLARQWPEGGPPVRWRIDLGAGFGGAAIVGAEVFVLDRIVGEADVLRCFSLDDGRELWKVQYSTGADKGFKGSRSVPTVTPTHVYSLGPHADLLCASRETKTEVWRINLGTQYGARLPNWLVGQSPLLIDGKIVVVPCSAKAGVVAFDAASGKEVWTWKSAPGRMSYVSPIAATIGGKKQIVALAGKDVVVGLDPESGSELWRYTGWSCNIPITAPLVLADGRVFLTGEYGAGSAMFKVIGKPGSFKTEGVYATQEMGSQIHQPILFEGHLYANSNGNKRRDGFVCLTLDGKRKWQSAPQVNYERGDLLFADGLLFAVDGANGTLSLIEPSPEELKIVSSCKPLGGKTVWAPMALSNGRLLVRDQRQMVCLDVRTGAK